ncbi:MAG: hypothetical protein FD149_2126 [Rhodospirillaceae bacterium]|nr:MAG: hypothetical protein FD149_2126 [Rhodospirillaceae bacterium]
MTGRFFHRPGTDGRPVFTCDPFGIRIDRQGIWHYRGSPINRQELVCLFASFLARQPDGSYWLITPEESGPITVDDVPFMAVEMFVAGQGKKQFISLRTNVDEIITVDSLHPLRVSIDPGTSEPAPYVQVRNSLEARLSRAVFYELVAMGVEEQCAGRLSFGVWSSEIFFPLGQPT